MSIVLLLLSLSCGGEEKTESEPSSPAVEPSDEQVEEPSFEPSSEDSAASDTELPAGDECTEGAARLGESPCGEEGVAAQVCSNGFWTDSAICLDTPEGQYAEVNLSTGYGAPEWDYGVAEYPASGLEGWSYYLRAFDLLRETPVKELGWGQWSKPEMPVDGLSVCGLHPHGFTCEDGGGLEGELVGCGHTDAEALEECAFWCCGEEDRCGVRGSIEGGMGYWMYTLETPRVKWMLPGATNANYEIFGGTFLHDRPQPCTTLGGAVRVANRLLVPNDFIGFAEGSTDGFLGYMLARTPIGKRSDSDDANNWTIVIDTANFAGPVMYMSSWFWDSRINWHPESVSWSDPRAGIGYIAEGFEGRIGAVQATDAEGRRWFRTTRWAFPQDIGEMTMLGSSTLFTGHRQYSPGWAEAAMEPMLAGTGAEEDRTPGSVLDAATAQSEWPRGGCNLPNEYTPLHLELETEDGEHIWWGFGVGAEVEAGDVETAEADAEAAGCHMKLDLDSALLDCADSWCEGARYLSLDASGSTAAHSQEDVPEDIKAVLDLRAFEPTRRNDGRYLGPPAETEEACFDEPGPASPELYCTRTETGTWIAYRWYRFVDQPELNQVFASMPESERSEAKCYMQARIERLHAAQQADASEVPRWFEVPQGPENLPSAKVFIDPALLVEPPVGMESGYVPVPLSEGKREVPEGCDVFTGAHSEEPEPLEEGHYEEHAYQDGGYDLQECTANSESEADFSYPGTVYPYPVGGGDVERTAYQVPLREVVGEGLEAAVDCP
jgi:hypothetical protein